MVKSATFSQISKHAMLVLIFLLYLHSVLSKCVTSGCRKAAGDILNLINSSVNPCEDFYKFTCGDMFKEIQGTKVASLEAMLKKEVDDQIILMLIKPIDPSEPKAIQGLKKFFRSCVDETAVQKHGLSSIKRALGFLGGWPVVEGEAWNGNDFSLEDLLVKLRRMGYKFMQMFYIRTTTGVEDQNLVVAQPVIETVEDKDKESYHDYMVGTAIHLGADKQKALNEMQESLLFKLKLLSILEKEEEFDKVAIKKVQENFPFLNWMRFINNILHPSKNISEDDEIYLPSTGYFKNLKKLLRETSNRTLTNYIIWEAIDSIVPYLPQEFRDLKKEYIHSTSNNVIVEEENKSRLAFCKSRARQILRPTFEALYVREYFSPEKRRTVLEIVSAVREEFIKLLNNTDLYDEESKSKMLKKAKAIAYNIGAPQRVFDEKLLSEIFDEEETVSTTDFLTTAAILNRQATNLALKLGTRIDFYNTFYEETLLPRAFYTTYFNTMVLPAATLQGSNFNDKRPQYLNFGTIGTILGYELVHGFTLDGSNYDYGPYQAWLWTNASRKNFYKKAECLIKDAGNFKIENSNFRMNGRQVLNENICDYTGVEIAYRAYENWVEKHGKEKQLPGLTYTPKQLFWISAASLFCDTVPVDKLRDFIRSERSAHPTFRTFGALSNNENFGKDFNCPVGSRMNPANKCQMF